MFDKCACRFRRKEHLRKHKQGLHTARGGGYSIQIGKSLGVLTTVDEEQHSPGDVCQQARKAKRDQMRERHTAMADTGKQAVQ